MAIQEKRSVAAGLTPRGPVHWNLRTAALYEAAVRPAEGKVVAGGPFAAVTAPHTGRSPNDKSVVREPGSETRISWGKVNQPMDLAHYAALKTDMLAYLSGRELFIRDVFAGADPSHRLSARFVTENAWHAVFVYDMFLRPGPGALQRFAPDFTVLHAPDLHADPTRHGTQSGTFIVLNLAERTVLKGQLDQAPTRGVPTEVLDPRATRKDPARYDAQAKKIAEMFRENFLKYADQVDDAARRAGPRI
jgi:phosphoenolpyruvate carboxykinase (ATP)